MKKLMFLLFFFLITLNTIFSEIPHGNLIVEVISEQGEVLPGATVTISSTVLMGTRAQSAGPTGKATFRKLPPGEYRIEVRIDGFEPGILSKVEINEGKTTKSEIVLKIGKPKEILNIVGTGPLIVDEGYTNKTLCIPDNYKNHMPDRCTNDASALTRFNEGNLVIIVMNDVEKALSGATVTVSSPSMKVIRELITGPNGKAIFKNMPADEYSVEAQMAGLLGVKEMGIQIVAGKTCTTIETLLIKCDESHSGTEFDFNNYIIKGIPPMIDVKSSSFHHEFDLNAIRRLP